MSTQGIGIYTGGQLLGIVPDDPMRNIVEISYILNGISVRMGLIEDTLSSLEQVDTGASGGDVIYSQEWVWSNQVALPPNNTQVRTDTGNWSTATKLFVDYNSTDNADRSAALAMIGVGQDIRIQQKTDGNRWARWAVTGSSVDRGGYYEIPVSLKDSFGTLPNSGTEVVISLLTKGVQQSPWTQDIDAAGYDLLNAGMIQSANGGFKFPDGSVQLSAYNKAASQTPWLQDIDGAGFRLLNTGNVGIGTSDPQYKLDVAGDVRGGYFYTSHINHGVGHETGPTVGSVMVKWAGEEAAWLRTYPIANFKALMQTPWTQNIDAASYQLDNVYRIRVTGGSGTSWGTSPLEIMGVNSRLAFHWPGVASQIGIDGNNEAAMGIGCIRTLNNPGTGFENFACASLKAFGNVTATGHVFAGSHVNTPADIQTGDYTHVAIQLGDNYIRWMPKASFAAQQSVQSARYMTGVGNTFSGNWDTDFMNCPTHGRNWVEGNGGVGAPAGGWFFQENMRHSNGSSYWGRQIAYHWNDGPVDAIWTRNISAGGFGGWVEIAMGDGRYFNLSCAQATNANTLGGLPLAGDVTAALSNQVVRQSSNGWCYMNYVNIGTGANIEGCTVQGYGTAPSANQLIRSSGEYIYVGYINSNTGWEGGSVLGFVTFQGDNQFHRKATMAHVKSQMGFAEGGNSIVGQLEVTHGAPLIDFKTSSAVDFDCRIYSQGSGAGAGLGFYTGANGVLRMYLDNNGQLSLASLPSGNPGAGSKKLWYNPAAANQVYYAA